MKYFIIIFFIIIPYLHTQNEENITYEREVKEDSSEIAQIKNNILKSLFFRGEIADKIIELNLVRKITKKEFQTYSELREYLIYWIEQNPDKAAKLYYLSERKADIKNLPSEITYFVPKYEINPYFNELIENLKKSAKDKTLSDEELRLDGTRLFEGFINYGEGHIEIQKGYN